MIQKERDRQHLHELHEKYYEKKKRGEINQRPGEGIGSARSGIQLSLVSGRCIKEGGKMGIKKFKDPKCPACGCGQIRYLKRIRSYWCRKCGHEFEKPVEGAKQ